VIKLQKNRYLLNILKSNSEKYEVQNVWRIELANRWRLVYTIIGNEVEIVNFIMDIYNHKDYDKVFGYKS